MLPTFRQHAGRYGFGLCLGVSFLCLLMAFALLRNSQKTAPQFPARRRHGMIRWHLLHGFFYDSSRTSGILKRGAVA